MQNRNDDVQWLVNQAQAMRQAAGKSEDEKHQAKWLKTAERMFHVADVLALALNGTEPEAMGGHTGLLKRLCRGTAVNVRLVNGGLLVGTITAMGRYDFALVVGEGHELVVPKHAVLYWELTEGATEQLPVPERPEPNTTEIRER